MRHSLQILALLVLSAVFASRYTVQDPIKEEPTQERAILAAAVEGALIENEFTVRAGSYFYEFSLDQVVVLDEALTALTLDPATKETLRGRGVPEELLQDSNSHGSLSQPLRLSIPCALAPVQKVSNCDYYNHLNDEFPGLGGKVTLSRPILDRSATSALVSVYLNTGPGTSPRGTSFVYLRKRGRWKTEFAIPDPDMIAARIELLQGRR